MSSPVVNRELNAAILAFLERRKPTATQPAAPRLVYAPVAPPVLSVLSVPSVPSVYVDNRVIHNPPQRTEDKEAENQRTSGAQVVAAAAVLTGTAVGLSYLWHSAANLAAMQRLRADCQREQEALHSRPITVGSEQLFTRQSKVLADALRLLDLCIGHASTAQSSKLISVGSLGLTATGSILYAGFLTSFLGLASLGVGCAALVVLANSCFASSAPLDQLDAAIRTELAALDALEAQANVRYPAAYAPYAPKED